MPNCDSDAQAVLDSLNIRSLDRLATLNSIDVENIFEKLNGKLNRKNIVLWKTISENEFIKNFGTSARKARSIFEAIFMFHFFGISLIVGTFSAFFQPFFDKLIGISAFAIAYAVLLVFVNYFNNGFFEILRVNKIREYLYYRSILFNFPFFIIYISFFLLWIGVLYCGFVKYSYEEEFEKWSPDAQISNELLKWAIKLPHRSEFWIIVNKRIAALRYNQDRNLSKNEIAKLAKALWVNRNHFLDDNGSCSFCLRAPSEEQEMTPLRYAQAIADADTYGSYTWRERSIAIASSQKTVQGILWANILKFDVAWEKMEILRRSQSPDKLMVQNKVENWIIAAKEINQILSNRSYFSKLRPMHVFQEALDRMVQFEIDSCAIDAQSGSTSGEIPEKIERAILNVKRLIETRSLSTRFAKVWFREPDKIFTTYTLKVLAESPSLPSLSSYKVDQPEHWAIEHITSCPGFEATLRPKVAIYFPKFGGPLASGWLDNTIHKGASFRMLLKGEIERKWRF